MDELVRNKLLSNYCSKNCVSYCEEVVCTFEYIKPSNKINLAEIFVLLYLSVCLC